jgi:hypothetical protein
MKPDPTAPTSSEGAAAFITWAAAIAFDAWLLMLAFGVLHAERSVVPTFGYWQCALVALVLNLIVAHGGHAIDNRVKKAGNLVVAQKTKPSAPDAWRGIKGDQWS